MDSWMFAENPLHDYVQPKNTQSNKEKNSHCFQEVGNLWKTDAWISLGQRYLQMVKGEFLPLEVSKGTFRVGVIMASPKRW